MSLYQQDEALLCNVFPVSLDEEAIVWFQQLLHGSVASFTDLPAQFTQDYALQIQESKQTNSLFEIVKSHQ